MDSNIASKFCELCNWTYESWITHKTLFDDNSNREKNILQEDLKSFGNRLSEITQEYSLLQISKLHDHTEMYGSTNLTIDYIVQNVDWAAEMPSIQSYQDKLNELWEKIKTARNKAIAHNDLDTLLSGQLHGTFRENLDNEYFDALQEFVNIVAIRWLGHPYPFNNLAKEDVGILLDLLEKV